MLDITIPPPPVFMLLLTNLLGYRDPTIVRPVLSLSPANGPGPWMTPDRDYIACWRCPLFCPALIKGPEPPVTSGEAGWTAGSTHLHHVLGTSQVWAHALIHTLAGEVWTPITLLEL